MTLTGAPNWATLAVAFSNGDGTFNVTNTPISNFATWAAAPNAKPLVGDFNDDGRTDVALTGPSAWTFLPVAFSNGDGTFNVTNPTSSNFPGWAVAQPYIIFIGTVDALNAVTLRSLKASNNTSVVVVEKVFKKPDAVALVPKDKITVLNEVSSSPLQKGMRALFVTVGQVYGESLAVKVVKWEPAPTSAGAGEEAKARTKMQELAEDDLRESINSVDLVVVGRIKRIQGASASELIPERQEISEHNPEWQEAIIEVQETLKGPAGVKDIVVRFPASVDIMWVGYPKFKVGQEGTFLLRQDRISGAPNANLDGKSVMAYMVLSRKDLLNKVDSQMIKRLLIANP